MYYILQISNFKSAAVIFDSNTTKWGENKRKKRRGNGLVIINLYWQLNHYKYIDRSLQSLHEQEQLW